MSAQARMDFRLPEQVKAMFEKVAALRGQTTSAYVVEAAARQAERDLREAETLRFNAEESRALVASLAEPFAPNDKLARALKRHDEAGL